MSTPADRTAGAEDSPVGYGELVRSNANFRRLWVGNVISLLGDWFNTLAIYALVASLTGSSMALGAVFIAKTLPWALASPLAGVLVDRLDRRRLMIASDLTRAVIVLGFLTVERIGRVEVIFVLTALQVIIGAVFEPARSAVIPSITNDRELLTANALSSITWSIMLVAGAALGGLATQWFGVEAVFLIDSSTYLISAFFIWRTVIPRLSEAPEPGPILQVAYRGIIEGWKHLLDNPAVTRIAVVKATWSMGAGALVYLLALLGPEMAPHAGSAAIGFLMAARGAGTGIGPFTARALFPDPVSWPRVLGVGLAFAGLCYGALSYSPWGWGLVVLVCLAHSAGGMQWVLSTVLLQQRTEDRFRGRIFATEWLLLALANSASIFVASWLIDAGVLDLRETFRLFGGVLVATAVVWSAIVLPAEERARRTSVEARRV